MARYLTKAGQLICTTKYFKISQIPHLENSRADALARSASADTAGVPSAIPSLCRPTVTAIKGATMVAHPDWREEILHYKRDATLLTDKAIAPRSRASPSELLVSPKGFQSRASPSELSASPKGFQSRASPSKLSVSSKGFQFRASPSELSAISEQALSLAQELSVPSISKRALSHL
ncbi:hypothetical protein BHM03_00042238 [Ensete ventricosum]|nr:hypothetical protein BHM03_00042238 [Ensete ventricosum]